jgi:hypothetical protein
MFASTDEQMEFQLSDLGLLSALAAFDDCVTKPAMHASTTTLEIVSISPRAGERVTPDTVVTVTVRYKVADWQAGQYFLMLQYAARDGLTVGGSFASDVKVELPSAEAELSVSAPLKYVVRYGPIASPLKTWVYLNRRTEPTVSTVVAVAGPIQYTE